MALHTDQDLALARQTLWRSSLSRGLTPEEVEQVAVVCRPVHFSSGATLFQQEDPGDRMYVIVRGRVQITFQTVGIQPRLLEYAGKGDHFGELAVVTDGLRTATATAIMDSDLLEIQKSDFDRLMAKIPGFATNICRALGSRLRRQTRGQTRRRTPKIVGLVSSTLKTQGLIRPLAKALVEHGNTIVALTERAEKWPNDGQYLIERIPERESGLDRAALVHGRLAQLVEHHDRVLVDFTLRGLDEELPDLLSQCEEIWWLVDPAYVDAARRNLERLLHRAPRLALRIHPVWLLADEKEWAPASFRDLGVNPLDFKVVLRESADGEPSRGQRLGIGRLVRHLQGTRIGVALGGGGARGFAHLGVLLALEKAGIGCDLVAGTSSGALMGLSYVAGWHPSDSCPQFVEQLTPHRLVRALPGGFHWYLWWMFRTGGWDRKLRPYLGQATLEQLQIPFSTVACDLVSGKQVVRDRGDAINAVLESINLPPISRPILRDGMALIDGGLLDNLPAGVLKERGADLVIGVDVVAKLQARFAGSTAETETSKMRRPGLVETLVRVNEVQDHGVSALRRHAVDVLISPDTARFEFADFSKGQPLSEAGEAAAEAALPIIRHHLAELDRR